MSNDDPLADMMRFEAKRRAARWYDAGQPEVSIVVLNFNRVELTEACLLNIWLYTTGVRYEIVVVDNGSDADAVDRLAAIDGPFTLVRLEVNRYFGEGNNIGAERAKGRLLVFLNNDAFVTANWLAPMLACHVGAWNAGAVGPKFVYPGGRCQEIGAFVDSNGDALQVGKATTPAFDDIPVPRIVDYCSAACLLVARELFMAVGGFDFIYEPAYYEDADLCFKIAASGHYIYCAPESCVIHVESATTSANTTLVGRNVLTDNKFIFLARWGEALRARAVGRDGAQPWLPDLRPAHSGMPQRFGRRGGARIGFFLGYDLVPREKLRVLLAAAAAISAEFDVLVVTPEPYSRLRLAALGRELSLDLDAVHLRALTDGAAIGPIDLCIVAGEDEPPPHAYLGTRNIVLCDVPASRSLRSSRGDAQGAAMSRRVVAAVAFSRFGLDHGRAAPLGVPVVTIRPAPASFDGTSASHRRRDPLAIVMIGRFLRGRHDKRQDLAIEALRRLIAAGQGEPAFPSIELHLAGWLSAEPADRQYYAGLRRQAGDLPVRFHPNAAAETLRLLLREATLVWSLTGLGHDPATDPAACEALGLGVLDAMAAGCIPLVAEGGAPTEFLRDGVTGFTVAGIDDLVAKSRRLIEDADLCRRSSEAVRAAVRALSQEQGVSQQNFARAWLALMERCLDLEASGVEAEGAALPCLVG